MLKKFIVFDVETNGLAGSSVLSISALKAEFDIAKGIFEKKDEYNRFYFRKPGEKPNNQALSVNGLYDEVITDRRKNTNYPAHFFQDIAGFVEFCEGAIHFVAHNIKFDRQFIPFKLQKEFCTMHTNTDIVKAGWNEYYGSYKWPKLQEAAAFYSIPMAPENLHNSLYDVQLTFEVFKSMFANDETRYLIEKFLR